MEEKIDKVVTETEVAERLKAAIDLLAVIHDGHSYYFDANDLRQLNYINGEERYYVEEDDEVIAKAVKPTIEDVKSAWDGK